MTQENGKVIINVHNKTNVNVTTKTTTSDTGLIVDIILEKKDYLLNSDWTIKGGWALEGVWSSKCIIPVFSIPKEWTIYRSCSWGFVGSMSVGWWAECDGVTPSLIDGKPFCPPKGTLIKVSECVKEEGKVLSLIEFKDRVFAIERFLRDRGVISKDFDFEIKSGPISFECFNEPNKGKSVSEELRDLGLQFKRGIKCVGLQKKALNLLIEMLNANKTEGPGLLFMSKCNHSIKAMKTLKLDEEGFESFSDSEMQSVFHEIVLSIFHKTH